MKSKIISDSFHIVLKIIEKVNGNAILINLDQSKLEAVLSVDGFRLHFHSWIHLL